jgi:hemin uptake protein HemP
MDEILLRKTAAANIARDVDAAKTVPALNIEQLFDGFREIRLFHGSEEYRLRLTRNDKLILTK